MFSFHSIVLGLLAAVCILQRGVSAGTDITCGGQFPKAGGGLAKRTDGCSSWSDNPSQVRDSWGSANFRGVCDEHDRCYYTLRANIDECNRNFCDGLRNACRKAYCKKILSVTVCEPLTYGSCLQIAETYCAAVRLVAKDVYAKAQDLQERYETCIAENGGVTTEAAQGFVLQTGTPLHETDDTFSFAVGDWNQDRRPDLFAIKKSNTGTKSTEVHILSGASNFQTFILQTGTPLHETDDTFSFAVGDWNQDGRPDLFAIKKSNTGTKSTEVHILSGASNFQTFILQTGTPLHETDDTFNFAVGDWNQDGRLDLFAIKKSNTGTKSTEVHILSGASNFQTFVLQTGTPLHETDNTFSFAVGDWNQDGRPDLFAIKKSNTGTKSTEVHILSGASNFQTFILQTGTPLHETDNTFSFAVGDWNQDGRPDLFAVKKSNTGTKSTEVHVISPYR
ncbi:hypothetical protein N7453_009102 [Penicillium expansum]|nr:hypothetical protein N7453_009102 [Penicillium expansum]